MTFLLDVNVLTALLWENHEHHRLTKRDADTCMVANETL